MSKPTLKNSLNISSYNPYESDFEKDQYVFYYHLLSAKKKDVIKYTSKWHGKNDRLMLVRNALMGNGHDWNSQINECKIDILEESVMQIPEKNSIRNIGSAKDVKFYNDIRGIRIYDSEIKYSFHPFEYSRLDYSLIEKTKFIRDDSQKLQETFIGFFAMSFNHSRFTNCYFENFNFRSGEFKHVIFYSCEFKKIIFNRNDDGIYSHIFFQNCSFSDVDFSKIDLSSFCFFGDCKFENIKIDASKNYDNIIGRDIIKLIKEFDRKTYQNRKRIKGTTYKDHIAEFIFYEKNEKRRKTLKLFFTSIIYEGLTSYYNAQSKSLESNGDYHLACLFQFHFSYCKDEIKRESKILTDKIKLIVNRYILGYGFKYERTLQFILFLTVIMSGVYLFTGINYNGIYINRALVLDTSQFIPTYIDWLKCLYFSLKTTTNIGQGNIVPESIASLSLSFIQGVIGFILFTIFVVTFSKRFFR